MLVAEKQLLDANLRNDLQLLRRLELKMMVNRFQNIIPAATMIGGFTFTGVVELDLLDPNYMDMEKHKSVRLAAGMFHLFAALALSTAVYSIAVSSIAIILGQRLAIQATAQATVKHERNVKELQDKFMTVLISLFLALVGVVGATICAIWARAENTTSCVATIMFGLSVPLIVWAIATLNSRLNDNRDESSSLKLKTGKESTLDVSEFRVGDTASIPNKADIESATAAQKPPPGPDERSSLLKCVPPGCGPSNKVA